MPATVSYIGSALSRLSRMPDFLRAGWRHSALPRRMGQEVLVNGDRAAGAQPVVASAQGHAALDVFKCDSPASDYIDIQSSHRVPVRIGAE